MPAISPPPPTGTNTASIGPACWRSNSMATVPWPAMTSGSSKGWMKLRPLSLASASQWAWASE
jgi:hypothetical protein